MPYQSSKPATSKPKSKMDKKKKTPKGFHRMPNGKLMKGAKHPTSKKK